MNQKSKSNSCFTNDSKSTLAKSTLPIGFCYLKDIISEEIVIEDSRYYGTENFLGRRVTGYASGKTICTVEAAKALRKVAMEIANQGFYLVIYDGYRPQRAVDEFIRWAKDPYDIAGRKNYYPDFQDKQDLFKQGYICSKSSHSRVSTFDLTIIEKGKMPDRKICEVKNGQPYLNNNTVDMGPSFDLLHPISHHGTNLISPIQAKNRRILADAMKKDGFQEYQEEWWHYTLKDEPFPDKYFDFVE